MCQLLGVKQPGSRAKQMRFDISDDYIVVEYAQYLCAVNIPCISTINPLDQKQLVLISDIIIWYSPDRSKYKVIKDRTGGLGESLMDYEIEYLTSQTISMEEFINICKIMIA